jgi:hypothetical protein
MQGEEGSDCGRMPVSLDQGCNGADAAHKSSRPQGNSFGRRASASRLGAKEHTRTSETRERLDWVGEWKECGCAGKRTTWGDLGRELNTYS